MVLLSIYRGTFEEENHLGTVNDDILALEAVGYIKLNPNRLECSDKYVVTEKGCNIIKKMQELD